MDIGEIIRYVYVTTGVAIMLSIPVMFIRKHYFHKNREKYHWKYELADVCFIFYVICLFQITAFRFGGIGWSFEKMMSRRTRVNGMPLAQIINWIDKGVWWHLIYNVIGNCIWFVPLGLLLPAIYREYRGRFGRVVFIGMIVSTLIEILQFVFCTGVTDIDDVIFNTIGTGMGYMVWAIYDGLRIWVKKVTHKDKVK